MVFDNKLRRGIPTVQEEVKTSAAVSADVDASFGFNRSTKSSTVTQGENKMLQTTKIDTVKLQLRASVILTITFVLALTFLTASSIFKASSHGSAYCLTKEPASAGFFVS